MGGENETKPAERESEQHEAGEHLPDVTGDSVHDVGDEPGIDAVRAEAAENWNKYLRAVAEIDNLRKRNAREVENARRYGVERLAQQLLPVRDSLEAGLKAAEDADAARIDVVSLLEGERATLRLLAEALTAAGIREIDPHGEPFDPERHEAMSMLPSADAEPGTVLTVIQKGYELNERVVRPARVIVASEPAAVGTPPESGATE